MPSSNKIKKIKVKEILEYHKKNPGKVNPKGGFGDAFIEALKKATK